MDKLKFIAICELHDPHSTLSLLDLEDMYWDFIHGRNDYQRPQ